jgi:isovaleryl-CoA dehydrogenase
MMTSDGALLLNLDLGETADAIRETVHAFSENEIAPRAAEIDRSNQFPRGPGPKSARASAKSAAC